MRGRKFPLWTLLGAVAVVALVVGSGVLSSSPQTPAQRAATIESAIRCPSCEDLSVANSSAPTAVTVRAAVRRMVAEGKSDQQITDYLVSRYGASIELVPRASGWSLVVWLFPVVGGGAAVAVLATVLVRRHHAVEEGALPEDALGPGSLEDRRRFLRQSLDDADAEYLVGDLSDQDYLALRHRDMVRLAALDRSPSGVGPRAGLSGTAGREPPDDPEPSTGGEHPDDRAADRPAAVEPELAPAPARRPASRGRRNRWYLGGAVAAFGAALIVAVSLFASNRLPGQTPTGSISLSQAQQVEETLAEAADDVNQGKVGQAAELYQSVLDKHADNEVALAQLGWLEYETGHQGSSNSLISDARTKLDRAVELDPTDYVVRLYLGTVLLQQDGNAAAAVDQYRRFLSDDPPATVLEQAAPQLREAYQKAGVPLPPGVGGG